MNNIMVKFWRIFGCIYLVTIVLAVRYYALNPFEKADGTSQLSYNIAHMIVSFLWFIPVIGLFLYSFNKRKFMLFWRLYFIYMFYNAITQVIEIFQTGKIPALLPFHAIALFGLFLYAFTRPKVKEMFR